ncbi:MAG: hypothetical protein ABI442_08765 [Gemmatimonadaceae bacterium]
MRARRYIASTLLLAVGAVTLGAQSAHVADSLLQSGALIRAESLYYAAVRNRPGDPNARFALGRYLVSRGAPRVGATLMEEAIRFGGDRPAIERELAPIYLAVGDFHSLGALTAAPQAERDRAKYLEAHETRTIAPDSVVSVSFKDAQGSDIGMISLRINGRVVEAPINSRVHGILISDAAASAMHLHVFPGGTTGVAAVADSITIGALVARNMPVTIGKTESKDALIGLDALAKFSPTFDGHGSKLTLRIGITPPTTITGERLPTLLTGSEFRVLENGAWVAMTNASIASMLRDHRWTLDARRGQIVVVR